MPKDRDAAAAKLADDYEERAAIIEYEGGYSRAAAERRARQEVYGVPDTPTKPA